MILPQKKNYTLADEIIARGLNRAIKSPPRAASEIWAEFDTVRARLANSAASQDTFEPKSSK